MTMVNEQYEYGLIKYTSYNIGDEIQSLAASRFLPRIDRYIHRERLDQVSSEKKIKLLMNAWWMWEPKHFPPADCIEPFMISMHVCHEARKYFSQRHITKYFKKHAPIGCRDYDTVTFFKKLHIPAYFSGCLTLSILPNPQIQKQEYILAVDLPQKVIDYIKKKTDRPVYSLAAEITPYFNSSQRFGLAKLFLYAYQSAYCVVTSRLHVTLPCLSLGTPILFVETDQAIKSGRFNGLLGLFKTTTISDLIAGNANFNFNNAPKNDDQYLQIRDTQISRCKEFTGFDSCGTVINSTDPFPALLGYLANSPENMQRMLWFSPLNDLYLVAGAMHVLGKNRFDIPF